MYFWYYYLPEALLSIIELLYKSARHDSVDLIGVLAVGIGERLEVL